MATMTSSAMLSLVLCLLLLLSLTINICDALPTSPSLNATHALSKRGCKFAMASGQWECDSEMPTTSQLIAQMQTEPGGLATANRRVVFYTNLNDPALAPGKDPSASWVVGWLNANGFANKYFWWGQCVNQYWLNAQSKYIRENAQKYEDKWGKDALGVFEKCFFQSMSLAAQHADAYILTPRDKDWKPDSAWALIELPTLTRNEKILRIWRIDPRPPKERGLAEGCAPDKPTLIWDRAQGSKKMKLPWVCPFAD